MLGNDLSTLKYTGALTPEIGACFTSYDIYVTRVIRVNAGPASYCTQILVSARTRIIIRTIGSITEYYILVIVLVPYL